MRHEFSQQVKEMLAKRVGTRCSNPLCKKPTHGPQEDPAKAINIGVAAHITAASVGGPRYDEKLTPEQRSSIENGIWLCQNCGKLVDSDEADYTVEEIRAWKLVTEREAKRLLESNEIRVGPSINFARLEVLMPDLLEEMKIDFQSNPSVREIILLQDGVMYNYVEGDCIFHYVFEKHLGLKGKFQILQNHGLVTDIAFNDIDRYQVSEELAAYLSGV
jgi:hypothetical protein